MQKDIDTLHESYRSLLWHLGPQGPYFGLRVRLPYRKPEPWSWSFPRLPWQRPQPRRSLTAATHFDSFSTQAAAASAAGFTAS